MGPTSGTNVLMAIAEKHGYEVTGSQISDVTEALKRSSVDAKDAFYENEVHVYIKRELGFYPQDDPIKLTNWKLDTGSEEHSNAYVELYVNGDKREASERGVGPIDAMSKAILSAINGSLGEEVELVKFEQTPSSTGTDAMARTQVALDYRGDVYWGRVEQET